ncbi:hypothetical protein EPI10_024359 [Gossypium australe]|uniref:Uncharacterized protein n=1 Tax=Gossypium australe TaxID=47621 RepID=A0A5B6VYI5_9ROSI|nr:hypothetical protein EPI10_024359 [Gossypium australe]
MKDGGGVERESNEEISLLVDELVQLSIKRLKNPIERDQICLISSPYWIKIGPCSLEFDKKDMLHAIGSTFGGVLRSEIKDDFCRLRVNLEVQKPLRRGGKILSSWEDGLKVQEVNSSWKEKEVQKAEIYNSKEVVKTSAKASWKKLARNKQDSLQLFNDEITKRKFSAEVDGEICLDSSHRVETKRLKVDGGKDLSVDCEEDMLDKEAQQLASNYLGSAAANEQADRIQ